MIIESINESVLNLSNHAICIELQSNVQKNMSIAHIDKTSGPLDSIILENCITK